MFFATSEEQEAVEHVFNVLLNYCCDELLLVNCTAFRIMMHHLNLLLYRLGVVGWCDGAG